MRWSIYALTLLIVMPILVFMAVGGWTLYESGRWFWLWWLLPGCWGLAAIIWKLMLPPKPIFDVLQAGQCDHWTPRDFQAWNIVLSEHAQVDSYSSQELSDPHFYLRKTLELADKLAQHYHPRSSDPLGELSVVEILAVAHLVSEDLEDWLLKYVPGSHWLTVSQWRMLSKAPRWWNRAVQTGWAISMLLNPINILRFMASRVAVTPLTQMLQQHLLGTFYTYYLRQAGFYLIELNSGRLKGGSTVYRSWMRRLHGDVWPPPLPTQSVAEAHATQWPEGVSPAPSEQTTAEVDEVADRASTDSISSMTTQTTQSQESLKRPSDHDLEINWLLIGEDETAKLALMVNLAGAAPWVRESTPHRYFRSRYRILREDSSSMLIIWDCQLREGLSESVKDWGMSSESIDLILWVSPSADYDSSQGSKLSMFLQGLRSWYIEHPEFKPPPLIFLIMSNEIKTMGEVGCKTGESVGNVGASSRVRSEQLQDWWSRYGGEAIQYTYDSRTLKIHNLEQPLISTLSRWISEARMHAVLRTLHTMHVKQRMQLAVNQVISASKRVASLLPSSWTNLWKGRGAPGQIDISEQNDK